MELKESFLWKTIHWVNYKRMYLKLEIDRKKYMESEFSRALIQLHNSQTGICFIIGNGPSLRIDDLEKLYEHGISCFGSNRIYSIYNQTKWRPKYYVIQDDRVMNQIYGDLPYAISNSERSFISVNNKKHTKDILNSGADFFFIRSFCEKEKDRKFADDISEGIYEGMSVTYSMIQIATYLGFREIYLLGVDHNYTALNTDEGDKKSHFEGMKKIDSTSLYPANFLIMNQAFEVAKRYAENHGIKIYNATRGGKLEIFPRVDFDTMIDKWRQV